MQSPTRQAQKLLISSRNQVEELLTGKKVEKSCANPEEVKENESIISIKGNLSSDSGLKYKTI